MLLCLNRHLCQKHSLGFLVVDHFSTTLTLSWFDAAGRYWYLLSLSVPPAAVAEAIVHLFTECYAEWSWGFGLWDLDKTCYSCFSQCSILRFWPTMNQYRSWVSDWTILTAVLIWVCGRFVCHTSCLSVSPGLISFITLTCVMWFSSVSLVSTGALGKYTSVLHSVIVVLSVPGLCPAQLCHLILSVSAWFLVSVS